MLVALVIVALAAAVAIAARSGSDSSAAAPRPSVSAAPPQRVVVPGRPGESSVVTDSDNITAPVAPAHNALDTAFAQMMIVHHGQAVEMAKLVPGRASGTQLKAFADRIAVVQASEIDWLTSWLRQRGLPTTDPSHDHSTMPGVQSPADMAALAALRGPAFDRKFVAMMIDHHEGALRMARDEIEGGSDERLRETAGEMAIEQGSEIRRMRQLR